MVSAWGSMIPQDNTGWKPFIYGVGAATIAGAGKELADLGGLGTPDLKDLGATILGGIISVGIITGVKAIIKKTPIVRRKRLHAQRRKVLYTQQQFSLQ